MSACEKCWRDANGDPDTYSRLLDERNENPCTPEQQAGEGTKCNTCNRLTIHMYTHKCVICGTEGE